MERYDAILLLGVELDQTDSPTDELIARADTAAQAYAKGLAQTVIVCGGTLPGHGVSEADAMAELLMQRGVPQEAVLREDQSQDTMENFRFAARLLGGAKGRRALVITSDYHMRRSLMTARRVGFAADGLAAALSRDEEWKKKRNQELAYTLDLVMGWQDEGKSRPQWTYRLFDIVFGKKK